MMYDRSASLLVPALRWGSSRAGPVTEEFAVVLPALESYAHTSVNAAEDSLHESAHHEPLPSACRE